MDVTVGIVTYKRPTSIARTLDSLLEGTVLPAEVAVVDDSPDDRTEAVAESYGDRFVREGVEFSYRHRTDEASMPGARNVIINEASGDVICFVDDDVVCEPEWFETIQAVYRDRPAVDGVGGPAIKTDENLDPIPEFVTSNDQVNRINEYGEVVDNSERWIPPEPVEVDVFRGANMSFKTNTLREIGGFNKYPGPAIFEEWDVMTRIRANDGTLIYHPDATLYHVERSVGGSRDESADERPNSYWYARNSILYRRRNFPEVYGRSLARLFFRGTEQLPSVASRLLKVPLVPSNVYWLKGYLDGLRTA